jgi:hypothetical protein
LQGSSPVQVAIDLELETDRTMTFLYDFLRLQNMHKATTILKEYKDQLAPFVKLFDLLKRNNTRVKDIRYAVDNVNDIKSLRQQKESLKKEVESIKGQRDYLLDNLGDLQRKYS